MSSTREGGSGQQEKPGGRRFPSVWHVLCLAIMGFLGFTGHVSLQNAAVVVLSTLYILLLNAFSFPPSSSAGDASPIFAASRILPIYVLIAGVAGLLLPLLYILHGLYLGGDIHAASASAAAPHLFLLAAQVVMEGVASAARFSVPVRAFVPIFYNSWRIPAVFQWARTEVESGGFGLGIGPGLAVLNVGLWTYNLFGFLLPVYLPRAFKRYYAPPHTKVATE